jgi:hypothetical protein
MNVIAVITDPEEVHKILRHLVKIGRSPPGLGAPGCIQTSCNLSSVSLIAPGDIVSFAAYRLLQKDSLLTQGWGRLMRKHNFYSISIEQAVDVRCSAALSTNIYKICGVTGLAPIIKIAIIFLRWEPPAAEGGRRGRSPRLRHTDSQLSE